MNLGQERALLKEARRIVVKVGTSTLSYANGNLDLKRMDSLCRELVDLTNRGYEIVLVSSGAIGAGMAKLRIGERQKLIPEKQALAAIGQGSLMHMYEKLLAEYGQVMAQVLLTKGDLNDRGRFLNARNTLFQLFRYGALPIINENDTVAFEEIRFGDNDTLAALVALLIDADAVILLTDIDGLYDANPSTNPKAKLLSTVDTITPEIEAMAGGGGKFGTGGMITKISAAKVATNSGIPLVIAEGKTVGHLDFLLEGKEIGTLFLPRHHRRNSRQKWILYGSHPKGVLTVDDGAKEALVQYGKSLLAKGICKIDGVFTVGDVVEIADSHGSVFARGVTNYSSEDVKRIQGEHSDVFIDILGYKDFNEVIHRDHLGLI